MKRQLTFIFLAFIMLGTISYFYVHNILLPVKVKEFFEERAQDYFHRRIVIDDIQFTPFRGFRILNLRVYDDIHSQDILFYADEVRFNVLLPSLIRPHALIIPALVFEKPSLHLAHNADQRWNVADLLRRPGNSDYKVLVRKVQVRDGSIDFLDQTKENFFESLQHIEFEAQFLLNQSVSYAVSAQLPLRESSIATKGNFSLVSRKGSSALRLTNFPAALYLPFFEAARPLQAESLTVSSDGLKVTYDHRDFSAEGDLYASAANAHLFNADLSGNIQVKRLSLDFKDGVLSAQAYLAPQFKLTLQPDTEIETASRMHVQQLRYQEGSLELLADVILDNNRLRWADQQFASENITVTGLKINHAQSTSLTMNDLRFKAAKFNGNSLGEAALVKTNIFVKPNDISIDAQGILNDVQLTYDKKEHLLKSARASRLHGRLQDNILVVDADLALRQAEIDLGRERTFYGDPILSVNLDVDLENRRPPLYKGSVLLDNALISGLPHVQTAKNITGKLTIDNDQLSSDRVSFTTLNTAFSSEGSFSVRYPYLADVIIKAPSLDLAQTAPVLQARLPAELAGEAAVAGRYEGPLSPLSVRNLSVGALLTDAAIKFTAVSQVISHLNGSISYGENALRWEDLTGEYNKSPLRSSGSLTASEQPTIDANIEYGLLKTSANLTYIDEYFLINRLNGRYSYSDFDAEGTIDLKKFARLTGKGAIDLRDLDKLPPNVYAVLKKATPVGTVQWHGSYKGSLDDWRGATLNLNGHTATARLIDFPLKDVVIEYDQKNRSVDNLTFKASVYDGPLLVQATGDLSQEKIPFQSYTTLRGVDLSLYVKDKKPKNDILSGWLQTAFDMKGDLLTPESFTGNGNLQVTDAYLGKLIPHNDAVYTEAQATYTIQKEKVLTKDARIISHPIDLAAQGWVDFEQNMNFDIVPVVKKLEYIESNNGLGPRLTETVNVKMTGTLSHPIKEVAASPTKVIKTTAGVIKDGIGSIVGEIFD